MMAAPGAEPPLRVRRKYSGRASGVLADLVLRIPRQELGPSPEAESS